MKRVNKETAVGLKEVGYDVPCKPHYYGPECKAYYKVVSSVNHNKFPLCVSAPDLNEAAEWLRDVKGLHISAQPDINYLPKKWVYELFMLNGTEWSLGDSHSTYDTHDIALAAGISRAVDILKERTNGK